MEKVALILLSTLILSGCSSYGMQGNPAAVQAGAAIGGVLGAIVGDRAGGYNASQFGALAGTVAGAAVGNAVTTPRQDDGAEEEYDNYAPAYSGLHVTISALSMRTVTTRLMPRKTVSWYSMW